MPKLNKKQFKTVDYVATSKKVVRQSFYQLKEWGQLRKYKLMMNPICQHCNEALATAVHHIHSFVDVDDEVLQKQIFLDYDNLMSVCHQCHNEIHNEDLKRKKEKKKD